LIVNIVVTGLKQNSPALSDIAEKLAQSME